MRFACFTDVHIHDQFSVTQTIELLNDIKDNYAPDLFVGLGDFFDNRQALIEFGPQLKKGLDDLKTESLMVYGNHDGSADSFGGEGAGWGAYQDIFGEAQRSLTFQSTHFITLADMESTSNWKQYLQENVQEGSIVFLHGILSQKELDEFAEAGVSYVFHGHLHMSVKMLSANKQCEQISVSSFRFGGMDRTPAGCAIIDLKDDVCEYTWALSNLPELFNDKKRKKAETQKLDFYFHQDEKRFIQQPDCVHKELRFSGSYYHIQCWEENILKWEVKNGGPVFHDLCPLSTYEWNDKLYVLAGGTWVPIDGEFKSLRVHDGATGQRLYDIPVVGLSVPPSVEAGVAYVSGQFRELVAFKIETGEILWSTKCETETKDLNWRDNRFGGGWSVTSVMIGKHLWVANFRGDLFGVEKETGKFKYIHQACLPVDENSYGVYAYTLGYVSDNITQEENKAGEIIFDFNGLKVNDSTGEILKETAL